MLLLPFPEVVLAEEVDERFAAQEDARRNVALEANAEVRTDRRAVIDPAVVVDTRRQPGNAAADENVEVVAVVVGQVVEAADVPEEAAAVVGNVGA